MSEEKQPRKFRVNGIVVRLKVSPSHPVVKGVLEGLKQIDADPLNCVSQVTVLPDIKEKRGKKGVFRLGTCRLRDRNYRDNRPCRIEIFAGSVEEVSHLTDDCVRQARWATRHEVGHAKQEGQIHDGLWFDREPTGEEREKFAEEFALNQYLSRRK